MFVRTENFRTFIKYYPVVTFLLAFQILIFIIHLFSFFGLGPWLYFYGTGVNQLIAMGQWWRLVTPIFLHWNIPHILFNSFSLFIFAPALEIMLGKGKFLVGYLLSGVIGNVGTYVFEGGSYSYLGASGALFGLFGFYLFLVLFRKHVMDESNTKIIVVIFVISLIMTFIQPNIDIFGHIFGFIGGFVLAPLLFSNERLNRLTKA